MGFYIDMIDVNQGDSFLLTLDSISAGVGYILIDGGSEATSDTLIRHLSEITKGKINIVIATHIDNDHIGGLKNVVKNMEVERFILNVPGNLKNWMTARDEFKRLGERVISLKKLVENLSTAEELLNLISQNNIPLESAYAGKDWSHGEEFIVRTLNPTEQRLTVAWADEVLTKTIREPIIEEGKAPKTSPRNDAGIVLELVYKNSPYALFTADVGADVLKEVIGKKTYTILKVPHHGSNTGLDEDLINRIKPVHAYLSVGENNFGHPATEVLDIIRNVGAKVFCTNRTKYCRRDCDYEGFGNLCYRKDKEKREDWNTVDSKKCINNS